MQVPTHTPWGAPEAVSKVGEGVYLFSTASHGGFWVAPTAVNRIPQRVRDATFSRSPYWYEEDCDAAHVVAAFPEYFDKQDVCHARQVVAWLNK